MQENVIYVCSSFVVYVFVCSIPRSIGNVLKDVPHVESTLEVSIGYRSSLFSVDVIKNKTKQNPPLPEAAGEGKGLCQFTLPRNKEV